MVRSAGNKVWVFSDQQIQRGVSHAQDAESKVSSLSLEKYLSSFISRNEVHYVFNIS